VGNSELGRLISNGEVIFREGDPGDCMYVILSGKVRISKGGSGGEVHITTLQEGEIFGEISFFDGLPRSATATSLGHSHILTVNKKMFFSNISRDPSIAFKVLEAMSARMRRFNAEYMKLETERSNILKMTLDLEETCRTILDEARDVVDADNGSIMLLENDSETLQIAAAFGQEAPDKMNLKIGDGIAGKVLETGNAQMINDVSVSPLYKPGGTRISSILCVPLLSGTRKLGVLNLSMTSDRPFDVLELKLIKLVATCSTIALESALQCREMKKAAEALTMVMKELEK
jgi:putative methionine-R-sulfoxide reductase with GAF domain